LRASVHLVMTILSLLSLSAMESFADISFLLCLGRFHGSQVHPGLLPAVAAVPQLSGQCESLACCCREVRYIKEMKVRGIQSAPNLGMSVTQSEQGSSVGNWGKFGVVWQLRFVGAFLPFLSFTSVHSS
jgi:hypothetical protein